MREFRILDEHGGIVGHYLARDPEEALARFRDDWAPFIPALEPLRAELVPVLYPVPIIEE